MSRRILSAWACLLFAASAAQGQLTISKDMIPTPTALAKVGLLRHWFAMIPLSGTERVSEVSVDGQYLYAQTNQGNFHVLEAETGRWLWSASLGRMTPKGLGASSNSFAVYVSNVNEVFAFAKANGQLLWKRRMEFSASSPTACDEERVYLGQVNGRFIVFDAKSGNLKWEILTRGPFRSKPVPAGQVVAAAGSDGKLYVSRSDRLEVLIRWSAVGPIVAPMATSGTRTLLIASEDKSLYSVDLFKGETNWNFASGAPIDIEPLVSMENVYVVNNDGLFSRVDLKTGSPTWTISTLGGPLLAVTEKRVYLESRDGDMFIVDRNSGQMLFDPRATYQAGLKIRDFEFGPTNRLNDRIYLGSKSGLIVCLREIDQIQPLPLRDPNQKPFGYIPPEGLLEKPNTQNIDTSLETAPGAEPAPENPEN
ncbi:MAG: PQQ-binding-like beta-propeller repeat protein [Isosphaeraceae bacterium]|nr:PQQ-binding-like beta-propeller repeat protein [Isosphaeraceae bacterium]